MKTVKISEDDSYRIIDTMENQFIKAKRAEDGILVAAMLGIDGDDERSFEKVVEDIINRWDSKKIESNMTITNYLAASPENYHYVYALLSSKNEGNCLISEYDSYFEIDEPVHEDFISRRDFINHTGVYVSASYFGIVYDEFKKSGSSIDEFVEAFSSNPMIQEVNLSGTFKYILDDDTVNGFGTYDDTCEPNIWEIVNSMDMEMFHKWLEAGRSIIKISEIFKDYDKEVSKRLEDIQSINSDIKDIVESGHNTLLA